MKLVILDLEWNGTYSRRLKGFINEIIEFGAVMTNDRLEVIDTFEVLVRPQVGKKISGKIETLTNISNQDLSGGMLFMQAVSRFRKWADGAPILTWGTSDILALIENCRYFGGDGRIPFLRQYIDLQKYCEAQMDYDPHKQMGLSTAAQLLGISEEEFDHHRALDDSLLSLECLKKLYDPEKLQSFMETADREFYKKIQFKTVVVCDLDHPLIKRTDMTFHCDQCGRRAHRLTPWEFRNKSFRAKFECRGCGHKFTGRLQFKLKYEGLVVKRAFLPFEEKPKEAPSGEADVLDVTPERLQEE